VLTGAAKKGPEGRVLNSPLFKTILSPEGGEVRKELFTAAGTRRRGKVWSRYYTELRLKSSNGRAAEISPTSERTAALG